MIVLDHAFTPATRQYYTPCVYKRWITIYALKLNMNQYSELLHLIVIEHALFIESSERRYHVSEYPLIAVHGAHLGPTGPRWAQCWPHELCHLGHACGQSCP